MKRFIAVAASIAVLAIAVAACAPLKTPVSAPPPPPKFKLAAGIWHTDGTAPGATECIWQRYDANGERMSYESSDHGARYVETAATDSEFKTSGCLPWHKADATEQVGGPTPIPCVTTAACQPRRTFADGDYIVGNDFGVGPQLTGDVSYGFALLNKAPQYTDSAGVASCHWFRLSDFRDEASPAHDSILQVGNGTGDGDYRGAGWIQLRQGEGIRLYDCNGMFWASTS